MPWMPEDTTDARWNTLKFNTKLGKWPKAESARIDAHFRMMHVEGAPYPLASRYVIRSSPFQLTTENFICFIDIAYRPGTDDFFGTSGISNAGREVTLTVKQFDPAKEPFSGHRAMRFHFTYQKDGGGIQNAYFVRDFEETGDYTCPYRPFSLGAGGTFEKFSDPIVQPTDWTKSPVSNGFHWITMSDCYVLEEEIATGPLIFAEFNDLDARINFAPSTGLILPRFSIEFDIRPHTNADITVMGSSDSLFVHLGFFFLFMNYQNMLINMGSQLPLDVWTKVRVDRSWPIDDGFYRVFWDDNQKGSQALPFESREFNQMGANINDIHGDFDLRNLKWVHGSPAAPITVIDTPLEQNACDLGPSSMKGTTINMALPSCP